MHRATLAALSLCITGCAAQIPPPRASLKDAATPVVAREAKPVAADTSIAPVVVTGGTDAENRTLTLAMFHALTLSGYEVVRNGTWRVTGTIENGKVTWKITKPDGAPAGTITSAPTDPGVFAVVPGVLTYLPRPSTRT